MIKQYQTVFRSAFTMTITSGSNRKAFFPWEQSGSRARPREVVPRFPGSMGLSPEHLGLTTQLTLLWAVSQTRDLLSPCCSKLSCNTTVLHDSMILWRPVCLIVSKKNPSHIKYIRLVYLLVSSQQHQNAVPMKSCLQRLMYFCFPCLSWTSKNLAWGIGFINTCMSLLVWLSEIITLNSAFCRYFWNRCLKTQFFIIANNKPGKETWVGVVTGFSWHFLHYYFPLLKKSDICIMIRDLVLLSSAFYLLTMSV